MGLTPEEIAAMAFEIDITPAQAQAIVNTYKSTTEAQRTAMREKVTEIVQAHKDVDDSLKFITEVVGFLISTGKVALV